MTKHRISLAVGVADQKKADQDALTVQINEAQYEVNELSAIVSSLSKKSTEFTALLNETETRKSSALNNLNLAKDAVAAVRQVTQNTMVAVEQTGMAAEKIKSTTSQVSILIDKLIFSVEIIDKVTALVNRQKLSNPLIPDELITLLTKATTDAEKAVATTLTALQSCYAAENLIFEAHAVTTLEAQQSKYLQQRITAHAALGSKILERRDCKHGLDDKAWGLLARLQAGYHHACKVYDETLNANDMVTQQLDYAQKQLTNAQTKLSSLKAGLAAEKAAAFAA